MTSRLLPRLLGILAVAAFVGVCWYPAIGTYADAQVDAGTKRALISFASARTLNAVISVIQGTEFSMQPMGVGVTLTLGQVLDPVNDLIEQFSSLMLVASVAFGVQKVLLAAGTHWVISLIVSGVAVAWAVLHYRQQSPAWLWRMLVVLLLIRLAIPVATLGSDAVFQHLLAADYQQQQDALDATAREVNQSAPALPPAAAPADRGWLDRLKDNVDRIIPKVTVDLDSIRKSVEEVPQRVVKLIVIFLMQTLVVPVVLIWALYKLALAFARLGR